MNFLNQPPLPLEVPRLRTKTIRSPDGAVAYPKGEIKGGTPWGFYMARVTDDQYRVSYSDPVFVHPPDDLNLKERYTFDEESGEAAKDSSPFQRAGELQKVTRIRPGFGEGGGALSFNGENCRLNLVLGQTPPGPLSIKMAVRPRAYGGMFFCDAGGMWMKTTPEGAVQFVRLGPKGPVTQTSESRIPLNQWSSLEFVWHADKMKMFINGQPHGESSCKPKFTSWRRALGCNPFGGGSAYYEGDIDDFEIRSCARPKSIGDGIDITGDSRALEVINRIRTFYRHLWSAMAVISRSHALTRMPIDANRGHAKTRRGHSSSSFTGLTM